MQPIAVICKAASFLQHPSESFHLDPNESREKFKVARGTAQQPGLIKRTTFSLLQTSETVALKTDR
jgi:hypothetical protein